MRSPAVLRAATSTTTKLDLTSSESLNFNFLRKSAAKSANGRLREIHLFMLHVHADSLAADPSLMRK